MKIRIRPLHMSRQEFIVRRLFSTPAPHLIFSFLSIIFSVALLSHFEPALMVWVVSVTVDWGLFWPLLAIVFLFSMGLPREDLAGLSAVSIILIMLATVLPSLTTDAGPLIEDPLKIVLFLSFFWQAAYLLSTTTRAIEWATSPLFDALNRATRQAVSRLLPTKKTTPHGG